VSALPLKRKSYQQSGCSPRFIMKKKEGERFKKIATKCQKKGTPARKKENKFLRLLMNTKSSDGTTREIQTLIREEKSGGY